MMDTTDRHCRYFLRLLSRRAWLYTEMIASGAVLNGDRQALLGYDPFEHPLALQVGGSEPAEMAACASIAEDFGYDEININVGCPSERVRSGRFGACLMAEPDRVADCVAAMTARARIPVTVKTRIGIDRRDGYEALLELVRTVHAGGCNTFIVHARKAWLEGLSPRQNREIPPLRYDVVHRLKADLPQLEIVINGGIETLEEAKAQLLRVDGVMLGRAVYRHPYLLAAVDARLFDDRARAPSRAEAIEGLLPYVERQLAAGVALHRITRHLLGLCHGMPGARRWRRHLSVGVQRAGVDASLLREALAQLPEPTTEREVA